jgi:hypothetical protein
MFVDIPVREAWIHSELTKNVLLHYKTPGIVAHGLTYICAGSVLDVGQNASHTLLTYMETGRCTLSHFLPHVGLDVTFYRCLFFRILQALSAIRTVFPRFRHNDLHVGNILLIQGSEFPDIYRHGNDSWYLPAGLYMPVIYDFGYSYLPNAHWRDNMYAKYKDGMGCEKDGFYDIHTFFNNILITMNERKINIPHEALTFIHRVVAPGLRSTKDDHHGRYWMQRENPPSPVYVEHAKKNNYAGELLHDSFFDEFKQRPRNLLRCCNEWNF